MYVGRSVMTINITQKYLLNVLLMDLDGEAF